MPRLMDWIKMKIHIKPPILSKDMIRKQEKRRRILEKSLRKPVNDVILDIQDGMINMNDFFKKVQERLKENKNG